MDDYEGIFDRCSRYGAIFLDEIGEVSKPVQIKLSQQEDPTTMSTWARSAHLKETFKSRSGNASQKLMILLANDPPQCKH